MKYLYCFRENSPDTSKNPKNFRGCSGTFRVFLSQSADTASQIASASAASFLPRFTYGCAYCAGISRTSCPSAINSRSEEHTSELQSLMRNSYAVFCLKKKKYTIYNTTTTAPTTTPHLNERS